MSPRSQRDPRSGHRRALFRRLQVRLLLWFLGAIVLAVTAGLFTTVFTSDDNSARVVTRHIQHHVERTWDDARATEAYVAELRETTGLDLRLRRTPPPFMVGRRSRTGMTFEEGSVWWPIVRGDDVVGALELRGSSPSLHGWRFAIALGAALLVLGIAARRVSMRLARPLEHVATTAERFGSGDLGARTGIDRLPRRWVAEEVRDVGRAFDVMADRIARVVLEQRELLAAISHELRSPLGRARVALEIARDGGGPERPLDDVERQLVQADAILGDLLASARAGLADLRTEEVELGAWLRARAAEYGVENGPIDVEVDDDATVTIDAGLLGRAFHNLFANAWGHGHPKDEPILVRAQKDGAQLRVAVLDRGPGFAAAVLPRAFEPFVSGSDPARSPGNHGTGLGLSLVRRIVEAHGGTILARNRDHGGAEVTFELPASRTRFHA